MRVMYTRFREPSQVRIKRILDHFDNVSLELLFLTSELEGSRGINADPLVATLSHNYERIHELRKAIQGAAQ